MEPVHFKFPFSFNSKGEASVVRQGTEAELASTVLAIASCIQGEREDNPAFGIPDPTFEGVPLDPSAIQESLEFWEPRAQLTLVEAEEAAGPAYRRITVEV